MPRRVNIMNEKWDYLIILDACRYDYFSKLYGYYFQGKLEKIRSLDSCTWEWCKKSFTEYYNDIIYVSANPSINSKVEVAGFDAKSHFFKVVDVWNYGWDEELGTVHPKEVNKTVKKLIDRYSNKRFIIHYLQPHAPYYTVKIGKPRDPEPLRTPMRKTKLKTLDLIVNILAFFAYHFGLFGEDPKFRIRKLLNLPHKTVMEAARIKIGNASLKKPYIENLKFVLPYVADLLEMLSGTIIVTTDHGELLGEDNCYGHPSGSRNPLLIEIPWLKIEKRDAMIDIEEKKRIIQKIKQLKSLNLI